MYTTLNSVLYLLSTMMPEDKYDKLRFKEWLEIGYRKINSERVLHTNLCLREVSNHKVTLPSDAVSVNQIVYKQVVEQEDIDAIRAILQVDSLPQSNYNSLYENFPNRVFDTLQMNTWIPVRKSTSTMMSTSLDNRGNCNNCPHTYSLAPNNCITTSFQTGYVILSYQTYPRNEDNEILIPDNQDLKMALFHFVMYMYYMMASDQRSLNERQFHLTQFQIMKMKATGDLNMPTLDELENLKDQTNRMINSAYRYDEFFSTLNNRVKEDYKP